jgi:energy-coupling factor transporter ATP-binding protein EcfA2
VAGLPDTLRRLSATLRTVELRLETGGAAEARAIRDEIVAQVDDYLVPRLERMEAPLLMVVGGSTGAGKSTLVNSLVGAQVSASGVLRPTTRAPVLVCNPTDLGWFEDDRVLPGMPRTTGGPAGPGGLQLVPTDALGAGLALLDAPDIDSVVEANRLLSRQLLAAADAWLFVTTAARYADAVPWDLLQAARERGTSLCLVLNRVPPGAEADVSSHLAQMLAERGLPGTPLLVVAEATLVDERLPAADLAPVREWLQSLAGDAAGRDALVRRTLTGALESLAGRVAVVAAAEADQQAAAAALAADVQRAYARAEQEVDEAIRSGSLLRGEVLARWHDVVGTGDVMRALESRIGRLRDRLRTLVTGSSAPGEELRTAVRTSIDALVHAAADRAAEEAAGAWRARPPGKAILDGAPRLDAASPALLDETREEVRRWQGFVFDLVGAEGAAKRTSARLASLGINGAGLTVMLAVFLQTGGLTGAEIVVAGGSSAVGQRVLEAILGDQAVRDLAERAREDLLARVRGLLAGEARRFEAVLEAAAPQAGAAQALAAAIEDVQRAR